MENGKRVASTDATIIRANRGVHPRRSIPIVYQATLSRREYLSMFIAMVMGLNPARRVYNNKLGLAPQRLVKKKDEKGSGEIEMAIESSARFSYTETMMKVFSTGDIDKEALELFNVATSAFFNTSKSLRDMGVSQTSTGYVSALAVYADTIVQSFTRYPLSPLFRNIPGIKAYADSIHSPAYATMTTRKEYLSYGELHRANDQKWPSVKKVGGSWQQAVDVMLFGAQDSTPGANTAMRDQISTLTAFIFGASHDDFVEVLKKLKPADAKMGTSARESAYIDFSFHILASGQYLRMQLGMAYLWHLNKLLTLDQIRAEVLLVEGDFETNPAVIAIRKMIDEFPFHPFIAEWMTQTSFAEAMGKHGKRKIIILDELMRALLDLPSEAADSKKAGMAEGEGDQDEAELEGGQQMSIYDTNAANDWQGGIADAYIEGSFFRTAVNSLYREYHDTGFMEKIIGFGKAMGGRVPTFGASVLELLNPAIIMSDGYVADKANLDVQEIAYSYLLNPELFDNGNTSMRYMATETIDISTVETPCTEGVLVGGWHGVIEDGTLPTTLAGHIDPRKIERPVFRLERDVDATDLFCSMYKTAGSRAAGAIPRNIVPSVTYVDETPISSMSDLCAQLGVTVAWMTAQKPWDSDVRTPYSVFFSTVARTANDTAVAKNKAGANVFLSSTGVGRTEFTYAWWTTFAMSIPCFLPVSYVAYTGRLSSAYASTYSVYSAFFNVAARHLGALTGVEASTKFPTFPSRLTASNISLAHLKEMLAARDVALERASLTDGGSAGGEA